MGDLVCDDGQGTTIRRLLRQRLDQQLDSVHLNGNLPSTSINEISGSTTIAAAMRTSAFKV
jgi:hypothetical protein